MSLNTVEIGQRIVARRKEFEYTQSALAKLSGISNSTLSEIESGNFLPSCATLYAIALALHCTTDYILTGDELPQEITGMDSECERLLSYYKEMNKTDRDELMMLAQYKSKKGKKGTVLSSPSENGKFA